jgi:hypothetical protein
MTSEEKLQKTKFFVEANSFEKFTLWKEWHEEIKWEDDAEGFGIEIGRVSSGKRKYPVVVSFNFAKINGTQVCFYYGCSQVVDHPMIEKYITKRWPVKYDSNSRKAMTDADNFHNCIHYCQEPH